MISEVSYWITCKSEPLKRHRKSEHPMWGIVSSTAANPTLVVLRPEVVGISVGVRISSTVFLFAGDKLELRCPQKLGWKLLVVARHDSQRWCGMIWPKKWVVRASCASSIVKKKKESREERERK
ncbi:hypothetical protein PanWU01x14_327610 [Parasponia andersonii]|uniref:Uncharacterized protein n=1 Tax=Parasponia andersonii TaxID=3476 RepID=A0A2P5AJ26_PARAD|nr:hypothetical protein PanWU01x14_327610 [Parasponia andersonii]